MFFSFRKGLLGGGDDGREDRDLRILFRADVMDLRSRPCEFGDESIHLGPVTEGRRCCRSAAGHAFWAVPPRKTRNIFEQSQNGLGALSAPPQLSND